MTTVADLIVAQARRTPDAVAVRQWDDRLTYRELAGRAAGLANALRDLGVRPETRVGICTTRDVNHVAIVVGVLLAGGCYVPLEPGGPRQRLLEIAEDAGVTIVVGDTAEAEFGDVAGIRTLALPAPGEPAPSPATEHNTAHVLYTSGSTGRPKGVLTTHRNIMSFVDGWTEIFPIDAGHEGARHRLARLRRHHDRPVRPAHRAAPRSQLIGSADRADPERPAAVHRRPRGRLGLHHADDAVHAGPGRRAGLDGHPVRRRGGAGGAGRALGAGPPASPTPTAPPSRPCWC